VSGWEPIRKSAEDGDSRRAPIFGPYDYLDIFEALEIVLPS
jgi:hypothetical protein